jgi:hypothetical protein
MYALLIHEKKLKSIAFLIHSFDFLKMKIVIKTNTQII